MPDKDGRRGQCVHCLRISNVITEDHVPPRSWYPDSTPRTVQRWKVPSCADCNKYLGQLEKDLLIRLALCVDPQSVAASGIAKIAFRSLGIDAGELPDREQGHREKLLAKIRSELISAATLSGQLGRIPGLGPQVSRLREWAIPIPWAGLSVIAEKFARGCEYKLNGRLITPPYGLRTFVNDSDVLPKPLAAAATIADFGPGCRIQRLFAHEDRYVVRYWISLWGSLRLHVRIAQETELLKMDVASRKCEGVFPPGNSRLMTIPSYLRTVHQHKPERSSLNETGDQRQERRPS